MRLLLWNCLLKVCCLLLLGNVIDCGLVLQQNRLRCSRRSRKRMRGRSSSSHRLLDYRPMWINRFLLLLLLLMLRTMKLGLLLLLILDDRLMRYNDVLILLLLMLLLWLLLM